jgi:PAS domain S-box-containing protein
VEERTAQLKEQQRIFRQLFDNSPDGILICDADNTLLDINPAFREVIQHLPEEITGSRLDATGFFEMLIDQKDYVHQALTNKNWFQCETKLRSKKGRLVVAINGYPYEAANKRNGMFIICRNLTEQRKTEELLRLSYERHRRSDFFNDIISEKTVDVSYITKEGYRLNIDLERPMTLFFLRILESNGNPFIQHNPAQSIEEKKLIDAITDKLCEIPGVVAWDTFEGIGILQSVTEPVTFPQEIKSAVRIREVIEKSFPDTDMVIGIAEFSLGVEHFPRRYRQARDSALTGCRVFPTTKIHHFLICGPFPLLASLSTSKEAEAFLGRTIDKLITYDRIKGTQLFTTLEQMVTMNNLKAVAEKLFIHYKTVLARKQTIEKLLGVSIDSFPGRTLIGTALTLHYLRENYINPGQESRPNSTRESCLGNLLEDG